MTRSARGVRPPGARPDPPGASWPARVARALAARLLRTVAAAGLLALLAGFALCAGVFLHYDRLAAGYPVEAAGRIPMESRVLDAAGVLIGHLHTENVVSPVPLEEVSPHFIDALLAREDARFHRHRGIDYLGLARAWLRNLREKRAVQGGSTITMQLSRMSYGLTGRTLHRKLLEMAIARRIERHYSKEEILSLYVNRVFLGTGMNGIEHAAQGYFGKSAAELDLPEAAMLAGVIRAPNAFSPFRHYESARREMRGTLRRMQSEGMLTRKESAELAKARPVVLEQSRWLAMLRERSKAPGQSHLMTMVAERVSELVPELEGVGGLTVHTTFDSRLQRAAEAAAARRLAEIEALPGFAHPRFDDHRDGEPVYVQGAAVVLENYTGAVRALVGGRSFAHSEFNRAVQARRPLGSVFKPLVYGTAFERGLFPGTWISDAAIAPGEIPWHDRDWSPENADGTFLGLLPAEAGLIQSRNTMTVRVGERAGLANVLRMMRHAGLGEPERSDPAPALYLGTVGANVLDTASAYSVFATGGVRHRPHFIDSIEDRDGTVLHRHVDESYAVLSPGAAWLTSSILTRAIEEGGTGARVREMGFSAPAGGKTGTTNEFRDAWFLGYTSRLTAGVWVGFDRPAPIAEGAYGGKVAVPLWTDLMLSAESIGYEFTDFLAPDEILPVRLCRHTGGLASASCEEERSAYVEEVPHELIPRSFCPGH